MCSLSLLLTAFALALGQTEASLADTCSEQTSCDSCYTASFLCHWCKDIPPTGSVALPSTSETVAISDPAPTTGGSCHYKLSKFGCQVGDACSPDDCAERPNCSSCQMGGCKWCASAGKCVSPYSWTCALPSNCVPNSDCIRDEPEFIGYVRGIPDWMIWIFVVLYVGIVVLSIASIYYMYKALVTPATRAVPVEEQGLVTGAQPSAGPPRRWLFRLITFTWAMAVVAIGILFVMVSMYWPSPPDVSMCNAQVMWSDTINMIINTVTSGKANVESEVLITVYNPNRLGLTLNSVNGNIYYKGTDVGTVELDTIDAQAGSAADGLGVVSFDGFDHIAEMYYDFNVKHALLLDFEMFVNFSVAGFGGFNVAIPKLQLNVNNPPPQAHCKCVNGSSSPSYTPLIEELEFEVA